jgi:hypothetical protein
LCLSLILENSKPLLLQIYIWPHFLFSWYSSYTHLLNMLCKIYEMFLSSWVFDSVLFEFLLTVFQAQWFFPKIRLSHLLMNPWKAFFE